MNKKPAVSVIIPVYGVEDYIEKCLQSLLDQNFTDFEAIIVDDGSLDQSIPKAKKLVGDDPRFIFLEKENGGQASARNMGLDYARGEYISFLDPDDYFRNDTFEICLKIFNENKKVSIVLFGISSVDLSNNITYTMLPNIEKYLSEKDILLTENSIDYSVCNKMYKKRVFKQARFIEGIIYEDKAILPILLYGENLYLIKEYLYFYQYRPGSTMNSYTPKLHKSFIIIYDFYKSYLKKMGVYDRYKSYYEKGYINYCFYTELIQITKFSKQYKSDIKSLPKNLDKKIVNFKKISSYYHPLTKQYISYILYKISPIIFRATIRTALKIRSIIR